MIQSSLTHFSLNADGTTTVEYVVDGQKYVHITPPYQPSQEEQVAMKMYMETGNIPLDYYLKRTSGGFSTATTPEEFVRRSIELAGK